MVWLAVLTNITILILAALLFFISDAILALDRFKQPFKWAEHLVMSTYFCSAAIICVKYKCIGALIEKGTYTK